MMDPKTFPAIVEVHGQCFVDPHRSKRSDRPVVVQSEQVGEKFCRSNFVVSGKDRVIQNDAHKSPRSEKNFCAFFYSSNRRSPRNSRSAILNVWPCARGVGECAAR